MLRQLVKPLLRANVRSLRTTPCNMQCKPKVPQKLVRLQKLFQQKNDLPVYLKGGQSDKILYYSTLGLSGLGLIMQFWYYISICI